MANSCEGMHGVMMVIWGDSAHHVIVKSDGARSTTYLGRRFNSIRLFNNLVSSPSICNTHWVLFFLATSAYGLVEAVRYIAILSREATSNTFYHADMALFLVQVDFGVI